jgi:hypothetical protein
VKIYQEQKKNADETLDYFYFPIITFNVHLFRLPETIILINFLPLFLLSLLQLILVWMPWEAS